MTDQFTGKVLADKYRIDSLLSENTLGNFYRGTHLLMEKPVSIKVLSPAPASDEAVVKRFADEARTISRISHPNILNVTDYGSDKDGTIFIIYESANGETLRDLIKRDGKFSLERANNIVRQIASGLNASHANGIVHRNLSDKNILVDETANGTEDVKISNFGTVLTDDAHQEDLSDTQSVEFSSPEEIISGKADNRSDIYSLGIITYEMLAGEMPFTADKNKEILLKHREQPPAPLSAFRKDLPAEIEPILLKALAQNPDMRYQSAEEFADAFNQVAMATSGSQNVPVGVVAKETPQNNIWKTAFIVLAGIAILGGFFIYSTSIKQTDPQTQLVTDANGIPVQPVNPATGTTEQSLSNMNTFNPEMFSNTNGAMQMTQQPASVVAPGGDGYDPWATGKPPAGAPPPTYVGPGGQQVYVDGNGSIFMPSDTNTYIMVPKNANSAANANTQPRGKNSNTNSNTTVVLPNANVKPTPAANTAVPPQNAKPTPTPAKPKPSPSPKKSATPTENGSRPQSGKNQDSD